MSNVKMASFFVTVAVSLLCWTAFAKNEGDKFTCKDGTVIPIEKFCDGVQDCDGSDEIRSKTLCKECRKGLISCSQKSKNVDFEDFEEPAFASSNTIYEEPCYIDPMYICNQSITCNNVSLCDAGCPTHYRCESGSCYSRSSVGDYCKEGCKGFESNKGTGFKCRKNGDMVRLPQVLLRDNVKDCDDGNDLCFTIETKANPLRDQREWLPSALMLNETLCFECFDGSMIIPRNGVCDGAIDCSDLSDECLCEENAPDICKNVAERVPVSIEEKLSHKKKTSCDNGQVDCQNGVCINRSSVCNSIPDCPDNIDERFAYCRGTLFCKDGKALDKGDECRCSQKRNDLCRPQNGILCDGISQCSLGQREQNSVDDECGNGCSDETECLSTTSRNNLEQLEEFHCTFSCIDDVESVSEANFQSVSVSVDCSFVCDGIPQCEGTGRDEKNCTDRFYCPSGELISIPSDQVCDGIVNCDDSSDEKNTSICSNRFFCSTHDLKESIPAERVCDTNIDCLNEEDESNCADGRFYCASGIPLWVRRSQVFDGRGDCSDFSDENVASSRLHLIAGRGFRAIIWIMGLLALLGNLVVMISGGKKLSSIVNKQDAPVPLRNSLMLVMNLASADFLMGIYLISIAITELVYEGVFSEFSIAWLSSTACVTLGILVVVSSEVSVLTMVLLASLRLHAIVKPFEAKHSPKTSTILIALILIWCFGLSLAFIPLSANLQYIFTDLAIVPNNPFAKANVYKFESAQVFAKKLLTYHPEYLNSSDEVFTLINTATNWNNLRASLGNTTSSRYLETSSQLGYYTASSVCIPRLLVTPADRSYYFSFAVSTFNFFMFLYILLVYLFVNLFSIRHLERFNLGTSSTKEKVDKQNSKMQTKIALLLATDFCCWVPVSIMAFLSVGGVKIPNVGYVVIAIILLPINSALNPIIYSNFAEKILCNLKKKVFAIHTKNESIKGETTGSTD